ENHPAICGHIVLAVVLQDCRCGSIVVKNQYLCRQPFAVKTIADAKRPKARHDNPEGADPFAARERQNDDRPQSQRRNGEPEQLLPETHSASSLLKLLRCARTCDVSVNAIRSQD